MKKLLLIFALIAVYGISISNVSAKITNVKKSEISVVADSDDLSSPATEKEKKDKKKAEKTKASSETKAKQAACCSETQKKSCEASAKTCCPETKKEEKK